MAHLPAVPVRNPSEQKRGRIAMLRNSIRRSGLGLTPAPSLRRHYLSAPKQTSFAICHEAHVP